MQKVQEHRGVPQEVPAWALSAVEAEDTQADADQDLRVEGREEATR